MAYFTTAVIGRITNEKDYLEECTKPDKVNDRNGLIEAITSFNMLLMITTSLSARLNAFYVTSLTNTNKLCVLNGELKTVIDRAKAIIRTQLCARYALASEREFFSFIERGYKSLNLKNTPPFEHTVFNKAVNKVLDRESEYWGFRITPTLLQHQTLSQNKNLSGVVRLQLFGERLGQPDEQHMLGGVNNPRAVLPRATHSNGERLTSNLEDEIIEACDSEGDVGLVNDN
ncbi:p26 [Blackcurrant leafroll-associated virus 1]|uniref:p26 n=1 Tax=Blackcurrant leafroll-associated virus 1 TaxID=2292426 RepID=UPI000E32F915|nr:p26 [Blackcurrant leafroll-associated virus 1]AXN56983.1 p26 [Blackcurrant leafroll-associated virus 1]